MVWVKFFNYDSFVLMIVLSLYAVCTSKCVSMFISYYVLVVSLAHTLVFTSVNPVYVPDSSSLCIKVKVKFSHTRYQELGPDLIPVYMHSARR